MNHQPHSVATWWIHSRSASILLLYFTLTHILYSHIFSFALPFDFTALRISFFKTIFYIINFIMTSWFSSSFWTKTKNQEKTEISLVLNTFEELVLLLLLLLLNVYWWILEIVFEKWPLIDAHCHFKFSVWFLHADISCFFFVSSKWTKI